MKVTRLDLFMSISILEKTQNSSDKKMAEAARRVLKNRDLLFEYTRARKKRRAEEQSEKIEA